MQQLRRKAGRTRQNDTDNTFPLLKCPKSLPWGRYPSIYLDVTCFGKYLPLSSFFETPDWYIESRGRYEPADVHQDTAGTPARKPQKPMRCYFFAPAKNPQYFFRTDPELHINRLFRLFRI